MTSDRQHEQHEPPTAAEQAVAREARAVLAPLVAQLPPGPLRNSLHGALRAAERAVEAPHSTRDRAERRRQ